MRRFSLLVLSTLVLASLPGFPLPTRNAAAALPKPSCAQKRSQCLNNALLTYYQCEIQQLGDCPSKYENAKQKCELNYQICSALGGLM
jgi:hypothetical protein